MQPQPESNAINRVLKAWGLPCLDEPGVLEAFARMIEDHQHLTEMLRACDPVLRREMYEALSPHLRFKAKPLESYIIAAKEHAESAQLPVMDEQGFLYPYTIGRNATEAPEVQLFVMCSKCFHQAIFLGASKGDAIFHMRNSGWAWDEVNRSHLCPECLDKY